MMVNCIAVCASDVADTEVYEEDTSVKEVVYKDAVGSEYEESVREITDFGIMTGYPDSTFRAKENITRAEFAVILTRLTAIDHIATSITPKQIYSDVPENHWASREIQMISEKKYISGVGNSSYKPEDAITKEQAVKILVTALGYGDKAERKGGWSIGYLVVGAELGIIENTDSVDKAISKPL